MSQAHSNMLYVSIILTLEAALDITLSWHKEYSRTFAFFLITFDIGTPSRGKP